MDSVLRDKAGVERGATRNFRYNDEALWGIGVPSLTFYPAIPLGHPDRAKDAGGSAYGFWWHTKEDDFEKADREILVRDTQLYVGEVYKAKDTRLDRTVAIKVLPEELASSPERLKRFEQEARAASALD